MSQEKPYIGYFTDYLLWIVCLYTFAIGLYPYFWDAKPQHDFLFYPAMVSLFFFVVSGIFEARNMTQEIFMRRLTLAIIPAVARYISGW